MIMNVKNLIGLQSALLIMFMIARRFTEVFITF